MGTSLIAAPIRASLVKRAYGPGPVTTSCRPGWADYSSGSFLAGARVFPSRGQGSSWSARSRAAARTNELDAGKRREILEGEEGLVAVGLSGSRAGSRCVAGGVVSQAPIRRRASVRAAAMTICPGTGLLSQKIELGAGAGSCRRSERARGLVTLPSSRPRRRCRAGSLHVGQQVPGAGEQLAGDRDGGDLLPALLGDRLVGGGELRGPHCRVSSPELGISHPERPATGLSWEEARPL